MKSQPRIQLRQARNSKPVGRAPHQPDRGRAESSPVGLQRETAPRFVTVFAQAAALFLPASNPLHPCRELKNEKIKKNSRNEVNPTSGNYGARQPQNEIQKKTFSPNEPDLTQHRHGAPGPAILGNALIWIRARPLDTLVVYVSNPRRPASSPSPSGDQSAAGPGLTRFCKSNERTPAAIPAGFFIPPCPVKCGLRS
jgi:hypothetical protein